VERLVKDKHSVTVIDNLLRGNKIPDYIQPQITFIEGDVRDKELVIHAMQGIDVVYHFAAVLGVDVVADYPVETMDVEVIGTRNVIEGVHKHKVKQLLYASTSGIYSHSAIEKTSLSEEVLVDPRTSYAMAKRYNEIYLASHFEEKGVNTVALRFFNVYGERQDNRMVIPRFLEQAAVNLPLTVFGDGRQTRDFTYIEDVIESCIRLLQTTGFHIVNIANEEEWTISRLAEIIINQTASSSNITYVDAPKKRYDYEVERRIGSSDKLFSLIGFKPSTSLMQGIKSIIAHEEYSTDGHNSI
jgi:UDP-glucose 4-epimerase